jgi:hypothetical protein
MDHLCIDGERGKSRVQDMMYCGMKASINVPLYANTETFFLSKCLCVCARAERGVAFIPAAVHGLPPPSFVENNPQCSQCGQPSSAQQAIK